jgi:hypothetical protein
MSASSLPRACAAAAAFLGLGVLLLWAMGCERTLEPVFPHHAHLETQACGEPGQAECPSCRTCHEGIFKSEQRAIEPASKCAQCHKPATAEVKTAEARVTWQGRLRTIIFSHRRHLALPEISDRCVTCHPGVVDDGREGEVFPPKPTCLKCHDAEFERGECAMCHIGSDMRRRAPRTFLRHDEGFLRDHGEAAAREAKVCSQCHAQSQCTNCHDSTQTIPIEVREPDAVNRSFVHRADFVGRHSIEARQNPARCLRCHDVQSCDGCHVDRGVSANRIGAATPHPVGWVGPDRGSPTFHGRTARRDIVSCATCHDQGPATNCIRCHKVGGYGGNPHPGGWEPMRSKQSAMCRYCHAK